jgi:translation elongation factor EF-Ts
MKAGRIETYIHSDNSVENKGAILIKVTADTDFAARTDVFKQFAREAAMLAYGALGHTRMRCAGSDMWSVVITKFPDLENKRIALERELGERVLITEMLLMRL